MGRTVAHCRDGALLVVVMVDWIALPGRPVLQTPAVVAVVQEITLAGAGPVALAEAESRAPEVAARPVPGRPATQVVPAPQVFSFGSGTGGRRHHDQIDPPGSVR